jgi:hypothetical protein
VTGIRIAVDETGQQFVLLSCDGAKLFHHLNCRKWYEHEGKERVEVVRQLAVKAGWTCEGDLDRCPDCPEWRPDVTDPGYVEHKQDWLQTTIERLGIEDA